MGPACDTRHDFEHRLQDLEAQTHPRILEKIGAFDPQREGDFDRGYEALVSWYRSETQGT